MSEVHYIVLVHTYADEFRALDFPFETDKEMQLVHSAALEQGNLAVQMPELDVQTAQDLLDRLGPYRCAKIRPKGPMTTTAWGRHRPFDMDEVRKCIYPDEGGPGMLTVVDGIVYDISGMF